MSKATVPILWRKAIRESDLPAPARLVAMMLSTHMDENGENCFPSVTLLERECRLARKTIWRALKDIENAGLFERKTNEGRSNRYAPRGYESSSDLVPQSSSDLGYESSSDGSVGGGNSEVPGVGPQSSSGEGARVPPRLFSSSSPGSSLSRESKQRGKKQATDDPPERRWTNPVNEQ